jgi:hypothetical protein
MQYIFHSTKIETALINNQIDSAFQPFAKTYLDVGQWEEYRDFIRGVLVEAVTQNIDYAGQNVTGDNLWCVFLFFYLIHSPSLFLYLLLFYLYLFYLYPSRSSLNLPHPTPHFPFTLLHPLSISLSLTPLLPHPLSPSLSLSLSPNLPKGPSST